MVNATSNPDRDNRSRSGSDATESKATFTKLFAFAISPLCPLLFVIAQALTDERYRVGPWLVLVAGVAPAVLFSTSLLLHRSPGLRGVTTTLFLLLSSVVWIAGTLLGMFSLLVADDPAWFH